MERFNEIEEPGIPCIAGLFKGYKEVKHNFPKNHSLGKKGKINSFMISIILKIIIQTNIKMDEAAAKSPYLNWQ